MNLADQLISLSEIHRLIDQATDALSGPYYLLEHEMRSIRRTLDEWVVRVEEGVA